MIRRIMNAILAAAASACLAACGEGRVVPPPTTPSPPITAQERTTLTGDYTLTVSADAACADLPAPLRARTYKGSVRPDPIGDFQLVLTEADLVPVQSVAYGSVRNKTVSLYLSSWELYLRWLEEWPIVERLPNGGSISLKGRAEGPFEAQDQVISAPVDGLIAYCPASTVDSLFLLPACSVAPIECTSRQHMVSLVRR